MILRVSLFFMLFSTFFIASFAQQKWDLVKDKNGIKIFTAQQTDSKYKLVKVNAILPGKMEKVESLLQTPENNKNWIYKTDESYLIKRISKNELISYSSTSLPWPASDRDLIAKSSFQYNPDHSFKVTLTGVQDILPTKKNKVRVPFFYNTWEVKSDGKGNVLIDYYLQIDPGGSLPAWVINLFVAKGPYETFVSLAKLIQ